MGEEQRQRRWRATDAAADDAADRQEGGLSNLIGSGRSRVGVAGAMRARDVSRPSEQDLAAAEREVVVRRTRGDAPPTPNRR